MIYLRSQKKWEKVIKEHGVEKFLPEHMAKLVQSRKESQ